MLKAKGNHLSLWLVVAIFKRRACSVWWRSWPTARTTEKACSCQWCYYYIQMREAELECKVLLSVIPANFSPDTFSWVCNVQVLSLKNKLFSVISLVKVYKLHRNVLICIMHTDLSNRKAHHKLWWCSHRSSHCISPHTCHHYGNTSQNWCSDLNNQASHQEWLLPSLPSQGSPRSSSKSGCIQEILSDLLLHLDEKWKQD